MTIETKTDAELIELWETLTLQINQGQTAVATSGIRVLSQIHAVLAQRGYRPQDGIWVKADDEKLDGVEAKAQLVEKSETVSVSESKTDGVATETETEDEPESEIQK